MKSLPDQINHARTLLSPHVLKTPLFKSEPLSQLTEGNVWLKLESEQYTGSFKARGALNKILSTPDSEQAKGFITASTGNHAQGFARALAITESTGSIYLPQSADPAKIEALKKYDVTLHFVDGGPLDAELFAKNIAEEKGQIWVSPYNDLDVIAGQGTLAHEVTETLKDIDQVLGCVGGGGMMAGVGTWIKHASPGAKVIGCLPKNSPEMALSVEKGEVVVLEDPQDTLSDGSAGGLEEDAITFDLCKEVIDDYTLISEEEIAQGIKYMVDTHHKIIEGSAAVALMSLILYPERYRHQNVVIVICGANITTAKLKKLI